MARKGSEKRSKLGGSKNPRIYRRRRASRISRNRDCLRPRLRHARNSPTQPYFPYTHGTAVDFIVPDRELAAAACGSSERKLLTPRLGDVPWEIEARRESRGSIRRS